MSDPTNLTHKQVAAIGFLLTERTHEKAAQKAGVSSATLRRWFRLPAFVTAYRLGRGDAVEGAFGKLQRATAAAVARPFGTATASTRSRARRPTQAQSGLAAAA